MLTAAEEPGSLWRLAAAFERELGSLRQLCALRASGSPAELQELLKEDCLSCTEDLLLCRPSYPGCRG